MSEALIQTILEVSLLGSIVVLFGGLLHLLLRPWMTAKWSYLLWTIIMVRFVVFVAPPSPTSFQNLLLPKAAPEQVISDNLSVQHADFSVALTRDSLLVPITDNPPESTVPSAAKSEFNLWQCIFWVWMSGVILLAIRFTVGVSRVSRLITESRPASRAMVLRFNRIKKQFGMTSDVSVRVSDELDIPAMAGLFRPVVLVPNWFETKLDHQQQTMVFTHELIHIRRMDAWIQLATRLIMIVHWFNPLVRMTWKKIADQRELSCDQLAIERLKSMHPDCNAETLQRRYGSTILNISIYSRSNHQRKHHMAPVLMGGFTSHDNSLIKQRIAMLVQKKSQSRFGFALAAVAITLLAAFGFTSAQTESISSNQSTESVYASPASMDETEVTYAAPPALLPTPLNGVSGSGPKHELGGNVLEHSQRTITMIQGETIEMECSFLVRDALNENPEVVHVASKSPRILTLTAREIGEAIIYISDFEHLGRIKRIRVLPDVSGLRSKVLQQFPDANVNLHVKEDGVVCLVGYGDQELAAKIETYAKSQTTLPISNDISDKDMVRVDCKIFEVSRTKLAAIQNDWEPLAKLSAQPIDTIAQAFDSGQQSDKITVAQLPDSQVVDLVAALEDLGIAKCLSVPKIMTMEGLTAEFRQGCEIPIRFRQANGKDKIEFREFGTKIELTPFLNEVDSMVLELRAEVSEIDPNAPNAPGMPHFRTRRINTGISMTIGSTLSMVSEYRTKGKADQEDTELVFFFTPNVFERPNVRWDSPAKPTEKQFRKIESE